MVYWIAAFFVSLIVFEELLYYVWNRYVYGKKHSKTRIGIGKMVVWFKGWKSRREKDVQL
jgi:hypothetical protein